MRKPKYVAVVRDDNWWQSPGAQTSEQLLDDFPEWKAFIEDHYKLEHVIGRFLIYRHAADGLENPTDHAFDFFNGFRTGVERQYS
jgi:hypothetical protein